MELTEREDYTLSESSQRPKREEDTYPLLPAATTSPTRAGRRARGILCVRDHCSVVYQGTRGKEDRSRTKPTRLEISFHDLRHPRRVERVDATRCAHKPRREEEKQKGEEERFLESSDAQENVVHILPVERWRFGAREGITSSQTVLSRNLVAIYIHSDLMHSITEPYSRVTLAVSMRRVLFPYEVADEKQFQPWVVSMVVSVQSITTGAT
ncbi:hypothetical protein C8R45DRAFT_1076746 [Mycena sanguinolenta]|nr:hypothetical protein C8R45DRAFT_1076746 [Mycena sanguinolenta]